MRDSLNRDLERSLTIFVESEYDEWSVPYNEVTITLEDREEKIAAVSEEIERDLRLLSRTFVPEARSLPSWSSQSIQAKK